MRKNKLMAWFIVGLMVFSVLGIVGSSFFSEDTSKSDYNGFSFVKVNNQWFLRNEGKEYYFQYLPQELDNITIPKVNLDYSRVYLAYQPGDELNVDKAINLIGYILYNQGISPQKACTVEKDCPDIPVLDCEEKPGLVIISGEENGCTRDEKCLIMMAVDNQELSKLTERLMYQLLKVIN